MSKHTDKTIAYIDRTIGDEILEVEKVDTLPRRGQPVEIAGERWQVFDVKPINDKVFDALVRVDRRDS